MSLSIPFNHISYAHVPLSFSLAHSLSPPDIVPPPRRSTQSRAGVQRRVNARQEAFESSCLTSGCLQRLNFICWGHAPRRAVPSGYAL